VGGGVEVRLELIEEYMLHGERRFRLRVQGTRIVINVSASNIEEAMRKAYKMIERMGASKILEEAVKTKGS
jgi:hypothetical protein